jgi:glycosyltransferase involved in cell wall biosynthesis
MNNTRPYRVILALHDDTSIDAWIKFAAHLTPEGGEIHLRGLISVPEGKSLSEGTLLARARRENFARVSKESALVYDEFRIHVDYQPMKRLLNELEDTPADLFIVQWMGPGVLTGGAETDEILKRATCDLVLAGNNQKWADGPVLLSLRGGPNLSLGVQVAKALAGSSTITLYHAADQNRAVPDLEMLMRAESQITRMVTAVSGIAEGIMHEAAGHKAIVLGATFHQQEAHSGKSGVLVKKLQEETRTPLVLVRAYRPEALEFHVPRWFRRDEETLSTEVDRWFAENTFDSAEFSDLRRLLTLKERQGVTISVALPALNEEETVGQVIRTLKTALMDEIPLVDEIVLIDSDSTDRTREIAEAEGVPVYIHQQVLPEIGSNIGKGEALWKSLHVLKGDIIAWVDTDITNIHPRFIYGLLGPMLKSPRIHYVKGFYHRPIKVGDKLQAFGGGRVTELVARPLFNLFYPELSGIIQPLSGEYAGRRAALEQLPFFSGYGVETGLLIDLLERFGLESIAQTDLETRVHHNQPLVGLSKMSFAILQVFIARLESRYKIQLLEKANRSMKLILQEPERFALEINEIGDVERPPMVTLPEYQERHLRPVADTSQV